MGKVAGAAVKVAAPEAAVAAKVAGKARPDAAKPHPNKGPAAKPQDQADEPAPQGGAPSLGNPLAGMQGPATGGGFVLGLMAWALVRAYIGNPGQPSGVDGVKRLLRAKFLNQTS